MAGGESEAVPFQVTGWMSHQDLCITGLMLCTAECGAKNDQGLQVTAKLE
jgi:hypothetical protein